VKSALAALLKNYCRRFCMGITKNRYYEVLPYKLACELSGVPESELFDVVLTAIGDAPELVGAERLFTLVGILASQLSEDEALEALAFGLDLFESSLDDSDGDGPWSLALLPPANINFSLAGYVWGARWLPHGRPFGGKLHTLCAHFARWNAKSVSLAWLPWRKEPPGDRLPTNGFTSITCTRDNGC
jgi:hypothetical protein